MNNKTKNSIIEALEIWMKENEFSANEFSSKSGVPSNYLIKYGVKDNKSC